MQKYRNRILLGLVLALGIYILMLVVLDSQGQMTGDVSVYLRMFPPLWLVPLVLTQLVAALFRFLIWTYYLGVIGARDKISTLDSAVIFIASFTMVVSPGKAAELLKSVFLKMKTDVPITRSAPIVIAERVMDGISVITTMTLALVFVGSADVFGDYLDLARVIVFTSAGLIGFGLVALQIEPLANFGLNLIARLPLLRRTHNALRDFYVSSREIFQLRHVIPASFLGFGVYLSSTAALLMILYAFGIPIDSALVLQALFTVGVTSAVGALSFVPNGAGVSEISTAGALMAVTAPHHPELTLGMAAAIALIHGFFHKWFRVLLGAGTAVIFRRRLFAPGIEAELEQLERHEHHEQLAAEGVQL